MAPKTLCRANIFYIFLMTAEAAFCPCSQQSAAADLRLLGPLQRATVSTSPTQCPHWSAMLSRSELLASMCWLCLLL